jgi:hypothetical protein
VCNEDDGDSEGSLAESSVNAAARELKREKQGISRCEACHESKIYLDIIELSCGHGYCRLCLQGLFQFLTTVESFLTTELKEKIEEKKAESSNSGRAYCSRMTCSVFIRAKYITGDTAICPECSTETCITHKSAVHQGDCAEDSALHAILDLACEQG